LATLQGISFDRFILWAVAEKVATLKQRNDDRTFPEITYVRAASGEIVRVWRGTRLRVQTVVVAAQKWGFSPNQIPTEYDLSEAQVNDVFAF
jgi:Na+-transporting NADH:ubiquinone oxidoreductase subunit NqrA